MGTLFEQQPRKFLELDELDIDRFIEEVKTIKKKSGWTVDQSLKAREILESKRKNDLYVIDGDIHDEHMAGFGELIRDGIITVKILEE
jgi:hypothetical protein